MQLPLICFGIGKSMRQSTNTLAQAESKQLKLDITTFTQQCLRSVNVRFTACWMVVMAGRSSGEQHSVMYQYGPRQMIPGRTFPCAKFLPRDRDLFTLWGYTDLFDNEIRYHLRAHYVLARFVVYSWHFETCRVAMDLLGGALLAFLMIHQGLSLCASYLAIWAKNQTL